MRIPHHSAAFAVALASLFVLPPIARSATIHVPVDQPTIAAGLQVATDGDTVLVACGTYFESQLDLVSGVTLLSETGQPDCVTIDGQRNARLLFAGGANANTVLEGFTLTNGFNDDGPDHGRAAGGAGPDPRTVLAPDVDLGGGGALYAGSSNLTVRNCTFFNNEASVNGGAVRVEVGTVTFDNCTFESNLCDNQGGALYVGTGAGAVVIGGLFLANLAEQGGAIQGTANASVSVSGAEFDRNGAIRTMGLGSGGAVQGTFCAPQISDCVFLRNSAGLRGGAVALIGSAGSSMTGCTFVSNSAPSAQAVLALTASVTLANCIVASHNGSAPVACQQGGSVTATCCNIWGNAGGDYVDCLAGQDGAGGNLSADPMFCDPVGGSLGLSSGSPCLPANNSCGVLMGALGEDICPATVPVTFTSVPTGLSVSLNSVNITTPAVINVAAGTDVTLSTPQTQTPAPDVQNTFVSWSDGGARSHTINVSAAAQFTATFATSYLLTMTADPNGVVTPVTGFQLAGAVVAIDANPNLGFEFASWTGTGAGSYTGPLASSAVTMSAPITQHAAFGVASFDLTMIATGPGQVFPGDGNYVGSSPVSISAVPDPGNFFAGWTGTGTGSYSGTANPVTITMDSDVTQEALFSPLQSFTLTMSADSGGTVTPPSGTYAQLSVVPIKATPDTGWVFGGWTGTGTGSYTGLALAVPVTMLSDISQSAAFSYPATHPLTMSAGPGGSVTPASGDFPNSQPVALTAVPDSGYAFRDWVGTGIGAYSGTNNPAIATMYGPIAQTANFDALGSVTVTTNPPGKRIGVDGVDYVSPQTFEWVQGTVHTVDVDNVVPGAVGEQEAFVQWENGSTAASRSVTAAVGSTTLTAEFEQQYLLTFLDPAGGTSSPGDGWYAAGTGVSIQATPNPTYAFVSWTGTGAGSYTGPANPAAITLNGPVTQTPTFGQLGYEFTVSASATDPFVDTDASTGGLRSLYLWMSCTNAGISAFEADLTGTLAVVAFTPAPGVLNAGSSTALLLAFTGCPGATGPVLAGTILVQDTGGTLCLGPSAANGKVAAVDCVAFAETDPVQVSGFSSDGSPPCFVAGASCLGAPPTATVTVTTVPPGLRVGVDGTDFVSPASFTWTQGSQHVLDVDDAVDVVTGTRELFTQWEGGPPSTTWTVTVAQAVAVFAANFDTEHFLDFQDPPEGFSAPGPAWFAEGDSVTITATPIAPSFFTSWTGTGAGSYTGPNNPATVVMSGPVTQVPMFGVSQVTITTVPPGKRIGVDGVDYVSPRTFEWPLGTTHTVDVDSLVPGMTGERELFTQWDDSSVSLSRTVTAQTTPQTLSASYDQEYFLTFVDPPEGTSSPGDGWHAAGAPVSIVATPVPAYTLTGWAGTGSGAYTGTSNPATVTMNGPITQVPSFAPLGYEFTLSASATDPFVHQDSSFVGGRSLYLWMSCTNSGISALEADLTGTLQVVAFTPAPGVLNAGSATALLLAFTGCPGATGPVLAGTVLVQDTGGTLCLAPSASNGKIAAVDCVNFVETDPVQVTGFTSDGSSPCFVPGFSCLGSTGMASVTATTVPAGQRIQVDGVDYTSPASFTWSVGSQHTLDVDTVVDTAPGTREAFAQWDNGTLLASRTVTVLQTVATTYTASFQTEHFLDFVDPPEGTSSPGPGWHSQGASVSIQATPVPPYEFTSWTGTGAGSYSGPNNPATVTMNAPIVQTPGFSLSAVTIVTVPPGKRIGVDGVDYTAPQTFEWQPGSVHSVDVDSLIAGVPDSRELFTTWDNGSTVPTRSITAVAGMQTLTATFEQQYFLDFQDPPEGSSTPGDGWFAAGDSVTIQATAVPPSFFQSWTGTGPGSYTGSLNPVDIQMNGPIVQVPAFGIDTVSVTVATAPPGLPVHVDGTTYVAPQTFEWVQGSQHTVAVDSLAAELSGQREAFAQWEDSSTVLNRTVTVSAAATLTATFNREYELTFVDPPEGVSNPGDGWHVSGATVSVEGVPNPGFTFLDWTGTGNGSYTGTDNPATVTMNAPVSQAPSFGVAGYEFTLSASNADPFVNTDVPVNGTRSVYLWLSCSDPGLSAFEADVTGGLTVLGFTPEAGVLNAGTATAPLLAVAGCPGVTSAFLLGAFLVQDFGGGLCLAPSAANGVLGAVDCAQFVVTDPVQVTGFSTTGGPCLVAGNSCGVPLTATIAAAPGEREVSVSWTSPVGEQVVSRQVLGFHVYRSSSEDGPFQRITRSPVTGSTSFQDTDVEGEATYHYQVTAVREGTEALLGHAQTTTPGWVPLVNGFAGPRPNPFGHGTELQFTIARDMDVSLVIYDVSGRLVRRLAQEPMRAGQYRIAWDGRNESGRRVPAGVYFSRLETPDFSESRKVVRIVGGR